MGVLGGVLIFLALPLLIGAVLRGKGNPMWRNLGLLMVVVGIILVVIGCLQQ